MININFITLCLDGTMSYQQIFYNECFLETSDFPNLCPMSWGKITQCADETYRDREMYN